MKKDKNGFMSSDEEEDDVADGDILDPMEFEGEEKEKVIRQNISVSRTQMRVIATFEKSHIDSDDDDNEFDDAEQEETEDIIRFHKRKSTVMKRKSANTDNILRNSLFIEGFEQEEVGQNKGGFSIAQAFGESVQKQSPPKTNGTNN